MKRKFPPPIFSPQGATIVNTDSKMMYHTPTGPLTVAE